MSYSHSSVLKAPPSTFSGHTFLVDEEAHLICDGEDLGLEEDVIEEMAPIVRLLSVLKSISSLK